MCDLMLAEVSQDVQSNSPAGEEEAVQSMSPYIRAGNGSMGHGSWVKWVTKIGWVTWVMGH